MLLTITTTHAPATDLGFLLRKNPARVHAFELWFGRAYVFYPQVSEQLCTAALLLEVDPIGLVRNRRGPAGEGRTLEQYVNDRPYVASSLMSVALADVFGSAIAGRSKERPELAQIALPLRANIEVVRCRGGGEVLLRRLFEPLNYKVTVQRYPLDENFPDWGESSYYSLSLTNEITLQQLLTHLYVLVPVLDGDKHYWIGDAEVAKLLRHGEGWLSRHPEKEIIARRYLKHRRSLFDEALAQLTQDTDTDVDKRQETHSDEEAEIERAISLNEQRLGTVLSALKQSGARRVLDLGCGEGRLIAILLKEKQFEEILGIDVSHRVLEIAQEKLHIDRLPPLQKQRVKLLQGSLMYRDRRLEGFDAAAVIEVIEHLDSARLAAFERVLFEFTRPHFVVITTPNVEYNSKWEMLPAGKFRHKDHRFEWTRAQFENWGRAIGERFAYDVRFLPVGPEDPLLGAPTQMALFQKP